MAGICSRALFQLSRRTISYSAVRASKKEFPDPLELATGVEKRELLAELSGNDDPYNVKPILRKEVSTRDNPNLVPSCFESRMIGCICVEDQSYITWMWLHEGSPRRCECGHWFKLVKKEPL